MTLYPYLPPLFAIYIIAVSWFAGKYAENVIPNKVERDVALDWEARIGFISAMLSSLVGLYSVFETSKSYAWLTAMSVLLIAIFLPTLLWIISHKKGQLATVRTHRYKLLHSTICAAILVVVNLALIAAIFENQRNTSPSAASASSSSPR